MTCKFRYQFMYMKNIVKSYLKIAEIIMMGTKVLEALGRARPGAGGALIAVHQFLNAAFGALAFLIGIKAGGYAVAAMVGAAFCLTGAGGLLILDRAATAAPSKGPL